MENIKVEYDQIFTSIRSITNQYWLGYSAFFAVNALLAAGFESTFSLSGNGLDSSWLVGARLFISATGILMAAIAINTAVSMNKLLLEFFERGIELEKEKEFNAKILQRLRSKVNGNPLTILAATFFIIFWLGAIAFTISADINC